MNRVGSPVPWYTYPAIQLVENKLYSDKRVAEFGAGNSTLWWAEKAQKVFSFEEDLGWYNYLKSRVPTNVELYHLPIDLSGLEEKLPDQLFDVVIVDGFDRYKASLVARRIIQPDGVIILDNSEGYWGEDGTYPIMDYFRSEGFNRVDFYGFSPGVILPHCTSMFFKGSTFLFEGQENPINYVRNSAK